MSTSLLSAIHPILNRFDFNKVHQVMKMLNWTWADHGRVPTPAELRIAAHDYLYTAVTVFEEQGCPPSGMTVACGGFQASVDVFQTGKSRLQLVFYVDEANSNGEY